MDIKETITAMTREAGFVRSRILAPFEGASLLVGALSYGNQSQAGELSPLASGFGRIAPFAQRNYYREGVKRLQGISRELRRRFGGRRSDFRILCNSPVPEKPLARSCGLGALGRNGLIITAEAGSLVIIAAMTLPYSLEGDPPIPGMDFPLCNACGPLPPCVAACPTGAAVGNGLIDRKRCIQWYASGKEPVVPPGVATQWGQRLYGCTACQDACPHNRKPIPGTESREGVLPEYMDCRELLSLDDEALKARFKGSALDRSWLGPGAIRRNAELGLLFTGRGANPVDDGVLDGG